MRNATIRLFALLVAAVLMLSGCSMIVIDEEMDNAEVVAEYTGGTINKGDAKAKYQLLVDQYAQYGYDLTKMGDDVIREQKENVLNTMVETAVVKLKAEELGFANIADDKKAELEAEAEESYNSTVDYFSAMFDGETEEAKRNQAIAYLQQYYDNFTLEGQKANKLEAYVKEQLFNDVTKDVAATDEQKEAAYQKLVSDDETSYSADVAAFESAVNNGSTIAWYPEGFRTVKHILVKFTDEEVSALSALKKELKDAQSQITTLEAAIAAAAEAAADEAAPAEEEITPESDGNVPETQGDDQSETPVETEEPATEEPAATEEPVAVDPTEGMTDEEKLAYYQAEVVRLEGEIKVLEEQYKAEFMPKAQEILDLLNGGADFDETMAQYGEDPGMQAEPGMTTGYYVSAESTVWEQEFTDGAMALQKIGDVSQPVVGTNGLHIIKYVSDVTPGAVDNEEVRQLAADNALETAKNDAYDAAVAEWVAAANVKLYADRIN